MMYTPTCSTSVHTTASIPPATVKSNITPPMTAMEITVAVDAAAAGTNVCHTAAITPAVSSSRTPSAMVRMTINNDAARLFTWGPNRVCSS